jgi:hypothetical protein
VQLTWVVVHILPVGDRRVVQPAVLFTLVAGWVLAAVGAIVGSDWLLAFGLIVASVMNALLVKLMFEWRAADTGVRRLRRSIAKLRKRQQATADRLLETERVLEDVRGELRALRPTRRHVPSSVDGPRELGLHDVLSGLPDARSEQST